MIGTKYFRVVRLAFFAALFVLGLAAFLSGNVEGGGAVVAAAVLTRDDLESILTQIFETADSCGSTKSEMEAALSEICDLADPDTELEQGGDGRWSVVEGDESEDQDNEAED